MMKTLLWGAVLLFFCRGSQADECARANRFKDVLLLHKHPHASPNLTLMGEIIVNSYNSYISTQDCDEVHYRQVETASVVAIEELMNDHKYRAPLKFDIQGMCVGCNDFQGLFDYKKNKKEKKGCKCAQGASSKLPTEHAFVEYLNEALQDYFEECLEEDDDDDLMEALDDHFIYPFRKLDESCPLGDTRLECILDEASFVDDVSVTFGTTNENLDSPTSDQIDLLGDALAEIFNDYANRMNDPRIVCSVETKSDGGDTDFTQVYTWTVKYDEAIAPGLAQVFGAPVPFLPTVVTERRLLKETPSMCLLPAEALRMAVFPDKFAGFVNWKLPFLIGTDKYSDLSIFSEIVSISEDDPVDAIQVLLDQGLVRNQLRIQVTGGEELTIERGVEIGKAINAVHRKLCDPRRIFSLIDFNDDTITTGGTGRRRLGGNYDYDEGPCNCRIGPGGRRMLVEEVNVVLDESLETCVCLSPDPPRQATIDDYLAIEEELNISFVIDREELNLQGCPVGPTEKIRTTGTLTFSGELTEEQIAQTEKDLCEARNLSYEEACTPDFRECLSFKLTLAGSVDRRLSNGERRLESSYNYDEAYSCRSCQGNDRVGGGGRKLNEINEVAEVPRGVYSKYCVCAVKRGTPSFGIPTKARFLDIYERIRLNRPNRPLFELIDIIENENEACERDEIVTELITIEANLTGCNNTGRDVDVEVDFCPELIASFNQRSAELCDPAFRKIIECSLVSSPDDGARRLEAGHRRLGTYSYSTTTSGSNSRIGGGGRMLQAVVDQDALVFGERLLDDDPIEQCTCFSDNPTFELVTASDWAEELAKELGDLCDEVEIDTFESEPVARIDECDAVTEKFQVSGTLKVTGSGEDIEAEMLAVKVAFCPSLNELFEQNCTPSFLKCLDVTLTLVTPDLRNLGPDDDSRRLETNTYEWTSTVNCGRSCQENKRISGGGGIGRALTDDGQMRRTLVDELGNDYTDFCNCPEECGCIEGLPGGDLPSPEDIAAAIGLRLGEGIAIIFTEDDTEPGECERDDIVNEVITIEANLTGCNNTGRDVDVEVDFCLELIASFNQRSAELCDPAFRKIIECSLVSSPDDGARRLEAGHRRLGTYSYSTTTSGSNSRIGGGGRMLQAVVDQDALVFGERLLDDDPIEQCTCFSDNPTFELVTASDWAEELAKELGDLCDEVEIDTFESEPVARIDECDAVTEKFQVSGTLKVTGSGEDIEAEMLAVKVAFCPSLNELFEQNCTPSFLKCLDVTLTLVTPDLRNLGPDDDSRRLETNTYEWTSTVNCGRSCQENKRISGGGGIGRALTDDGQMRRTLVDELGNDYTDFCNCPEECVCDEGLPGGDLPSPEDIAAAIGLRLGGSIAIIFTEDDTEPGECVRDDTVTEVVTVEADLSSCVEDVEADFCDELVASFNELSFELCDPDYRKIIECSLVSSPQAGRRLEAGHRRLGSYSYSTTTSGSNSRVGGGGRRLAEATEVTESGGIFGERYLNDDPIEQCTCFSGNPTFESVTTALWREKLEMVLESKCVSANVTDVSVEGYQVPCEADRQACIIQLDVEFDCTGVECPPDVELLEGYFAIVYSELYGSKYCGYLDRSPISVSIDSFPESGPSLITIGFDCLDGCNMLPGEPSIFDEAPSPLSLGSANRVQSYKPVHL